ncbi:hypothetical protein TrRE_jg8247 [Triparma retinervis]|uniref:Tryptophan synthase beta chain-like PALP domain-containing protein n=1 Tax=Triparma retinervis TaxID=2557542 RepID=A0A9W7FXP8_9STRA|nr:hypothetical protein TrRE_jg8247 [Triparma retinervis]
MRSHALATSAIDAIGNTPLVKLGNILPNLGLPSTTKLFAKLDNLSVGGSKKDRVAKQMVLDGYDSGELVSGQPIIELTSGNTGTGLAIVCAALNHPFIAVMSSGNSVERARQMRALGSEVVVVPQAPGSVNGQVSGEDLKLVEAVTKNLVDGFVSVSDEEAVNTARLLAKKEGIFGGFSAGANLTAAVKLIREGKVEAEEGVAFMVCDTGLKYLSTDLYL